MRKFRSRPEQPRIVDAIQLVEDIGYWQYWQHDDNEWKTIAKKGDWLVIDNNCQYFLTNKEIKEKFEELY